jgi:hypothetical protein
MQVMAWSNVAAPQRYQHVTGTVLDTVTDQVGGYLWEKPRKSTNER